METNKTTTTEKKKANLGREGGRIKKARGRIGKVLRPSGLTRTFFFRGLDLDLTKNAPTFFHGARLTPQLTKQYTQSRQRKRGTGVNSEITERKTNMVSFICTLCNETLKKPKLVQHAQKCPPGWYSCLDCQREFRGEREFKVTKPIHWMR